MNPERSAGDVPSPAKTAVGKTVLIVEDDEEVRKMLQTVLSHSMGLNVIAAKDGRTGVSAAQSALPDLILMDLMLPELDGFEATTHLRANGNTAHIPVIAMSNYCWDLDWKAKAIAAGCILCFDKGAGIKEWVDIVQQGLDAAAQVGRDGTGRPLTEEGG